MLDSLIRTKLRDEWCPDTALRYGWMTEGEMQGPLTIVEAKCAKCDEHLKWSDCSFCMDHCDADDYGQPVPKRIGYHSVMNLPRIVLVEATEECRCCK